MTDETFPHEIWADLDHWIEGPAASDLRAQGYMKYIRQDVSDVLIAAAYVDAANLHQSLWRETSAYKTDQILKRTPTDARQALDALLKAERERALREAAEICDEERNNLNALTSNPPQSAAAVAARNRIEALISEDATDG